MLSHTTTATRPRRMLGWTSGGSLSSAIAATLTAGLLLTNTEVEVYGDFGVLIALAYFTSNALRLGADRMIVGEVRRSPGSEGCQLGQDLLAFSALMASLGLIAILALPLGAVIALAQSTPLTRIEMALFGFLIAADTVRLTAAEALRANLRVVAATLASSGGRSVLFGLFTAVLVVSESESIGRLTLLTGAASASILTGLFAMLSVRREFRIMRGSPLTRLRDHWRGHLAMAGATGATAIIAVADVWMVGLFFGAAAAGRYSLAVSAVGLIGIVLTATQTGIQPYLAERLGRGDTESARHLSTRLAAFGVLVGAAALLVAVVVGEPVAVALGGDGYRGVRWLILVLGLGVVSALAIGPAAAGLTATTRYAVFGRLAMTTAGFAIVTEVSAGLLAWSELAIAFASAASVTLLHGLSWFQLKRLEDMRTDAFAYAVR